MSTIMDDSPDNLDDMTTWGDRVQEVLDAMGGQKPMKPAELARRLKLSKQAVSNWLTGKSGPTPENVFALADMSGFNARWLAIGKGPRRLDGKQLVSDAQTLWDKYCAATDDARHVVDYALRNPDTAIGEKPKAL